MNSTATKKPLYDLVDENKQKPGEHERTAIRRAILAHLSSVIPEIKNRIFISMRLPRDFSEFPGLYIYTESETSERFNHMTDERTLQTILSVVVKAGGEIKEAEMQDQADDFSKIIDDAIKLNPSLSDLVNDMRYSRTDIDFDDAGEQAIFVNKMEYAVIYYHNTPVVTGLKEFRLVKGDLRQSEDEDVLTMSVEQELPGANNDD